MKKKTIIHYMTKTPSYFDWETQFRSKKQSQKRKKKKKKPNSLEIDEEDLKYFLKQWKMNNLPFKKQK